MPLQSLAATAGCLWGGDVCAALSAGTGAAPSSRTVSVTAVGCQSIVDPDVPCRPMAMRSSTPPGARMERLSSTGPDGARRAVFIDRTRAGPCAGRSAPPPRAHGPPGHGRRRPRPSPPAACRRRGGSRRCSRAHLRHLVEQAHGLVRIPGHDLAHRLCLDGEHRQGMRQHVVHVARDARALLEGGEPRGPLQRGLQVGLGHAETRHLRAESRWATCSRRI